MWSVQCWRYLLLRQCVYRWPRVGLDGTWATGRLSQGEDASSFDREENCVTETDRELLQRFVGAFERLDSLGMSSRNQIDGDISGLLLVPRKEDDEWLEWAPTATEVPAEILREFYHVISGPLPPLYELLITSFRWAEVDLCRLRLLANLPPRLDGLIAGMTRDKVLFETLVPAGFVQFGKGADLNYDPVCFDLRARRQDGDCPIVMFDHEEILCNRRLKKTVEMAPAFRSLVKTIVQDADGKPPMARLL